MNLPRFSASAVYELRTKMQAQLDAIGLEYGVVFSIGKIRYSEKDFRFKCEAKLVGPAAVSNPELIAKQDFDANCQLHGLLPEDFGKTVLLDCRSSRESFIIVGIRTGRRSAYPILVKKVSNGKTYRYLAGGVRKALGRPFPWETR